jgi:hypothetical protein
LVLIILFGLIVLPIIIILWRKALKRNNDWFFQPSGNLALLLNQFKLNQENGLQEVTALLSIDLFVYFCSVWLNPSDFQSWEKDWCLAWRSVNAYPCFREAFKRCGTVPTLIAYVNFPIAAALKIVTVSQTRQRFSISATPVII